MLVLVVNRHTYDGVDFEYVGRGTPLGNTQGRAGIDGTRTQVIAKFKKWLLEQIQLRNPAVLGELRRLKAIGDTKYVVKIACSCSPKSCHADVIKWVLDNWSTLMAGTEFDEIPQKDINADQKKSSEDLKDINGDNKPVDQE